ncbi:MAG: phosphoadenosine phosphosulfate reductase family protein [Bacteroidales bacterium]|nr:phosphoadenosine phosphosulfate reductase family protein [Bacteroidales bacterium]
MFYVTWDPETGGVRLNTLRAKETLGISPRPVFYEELDLLKLDQLGWTYPRCKEPLLWACNKQYFYRGQLVFEAKGANIYDPAKIIFQEGCEKMELIPVDVEAMLKVCEDEMFLAESEAIEFIRNTYIQYASARESVERVKANQLDYEAMVAKLEKETKKKMAIVKQDCDSFDIMEEENAKQSGKKTYVTTKIDKFLASFSGGKDSQVVLDLCTRAIPPSEFEVIYSDTGYELPTSLTLWEEVQTYYKAKFPELRFRTARNHESVLNYWDKIGTPSDTHRWCCSVMKTAPLYRLMKIGDTNRQAKVLAFDGVRAEESTRRSGYNRKGKGKNSTVFNASPILFWNTVEVFLYIFHYDLPINVSYRQGMTRVGCLICPFGSEWNEMIVSKLQQKQITPFLSKIVSTVKSTGVADVENYIKEGNWKRRAGGKGLKFPSYLVIESTKPDLKVRCVNPQLEILTYFCAIGKYEIVKTQEGFSGELLFQQEVYPFQIIQMKQDIIVSFFNTYNKPALQGLIKRALYKAVYCIRCEACEVECPTGALGILSQPIINNKMCVHCHKCLLFHELGCIVAHSLNVTGNNNNNNMKLTSYNNFGLREEWLDVFMSSPNSYFEDNIHGLHPKEQLPNFVKWISQAGIIDDTKSRQLTHLGNILSEIYLDQPEIVWEIIWINLTYGSPIAKWYKEKIEWGFLFTQADIQELVKNDYAESPTTIKNIVYALMRTFRESPIGAMGVCTEMDKQHFSKIPHEELSREALAYSLYLYAENKNSRTFRVSDLYSSDNLLGIYREFGTSKNAVEKLLRSLNSDSNRVLNADLNMGLDHITLREDLDSVKTLSILTGLI